MLYAHLHGNRRMRIVSLHNEIIADKFVYLLDLSLETQLWEGARFTLQLLVERVDVIPVDVRVSKLDNELVRLRVRDVRDHVGEERIRRDVERYSESQICRALVHQARQLWFLGGRGW